MEKYILDILFLVWIHCLMDFSLQGDFLAINKGKNIGIMCVHCMIWTGGITVGLYLITHTVNLSLSILLFIGHFICDKIKCNAADKSKALTKHLLYDQLFHLLQIIVVYLLIIFK